MGRAFTYITVLAVVAAISGAAAASDAADRIDALRLDSSISGAAGSAIDDALVGADGPVQISIRLDEPSLSRGGSAAAIRAQQAEVISLIQAAGGTVEGSVQTVLNAVFATIDAAEVAGIATSASVATIREVADYELDLSETVEYIGGSAVQNQGVDGTGVLVAVLDSGIDYEHANLGGSGDVADYEANDPTIVEGGSFANGKVVGGFDFVGEVWPDGPLTPDPDPLDSGVAGGHGTHVAHIIGGVPSAEFSFGGVAPGADLLAVKVCSSVSTSCSGLALILGLEFAVEQGADIINMSLGSVYGQAFDDDLSAAVDGATAAGVLTVASAGNSSDKPYVTGSPAAAPTALSVAQTQVPSAVLPFLEIIDSQDNSAIITAVYQPWSGDPAAQIDPGDPDPVLEGPLVYGNGQGGNLDGCAPFAVDLTGNVVLVDRGACAFTAKIANIAEAGGIAGIIGLIAPGEPFQGGFDGAGCRELCDDIPGYMISQNDSTALKNTLATGPTSVVIDPTQGEFLVGTMVGSSSRGPSMNFDNLLKPEIGAPGASVSAEYATGTGVNPFGGTSGAAPMVSGSAALLLDAEEGLGPLELKARLVTTAETDIDTEPGAGLAPVSRIGGGEVRVDRAVASGAAAWDAVTSSPALSFGFIDVTGTIELTKTVHVQNYGDEVLDFDIATEFRYADDESGAVSVSTPGSVSVPAGGSAMFDVILSIEGALLDDWYGNSGFNGANPGWLTDLEYDGYVRLDADGEANDIHMPWHVLPRKAADVEADRRGKNVTLTNAGVGDTTLEFYHLLATSADLPEGARGEQNPTPDIRAAGVAFFDGADFGCTSDVLVKFAVNTWERQTHANAPASFEFDIDVDNDGTLDYAVFNLDLSLLSSGALTLSDGRNVVYALNLATGETSVFWFTDHDTNSANTVLWACGEQIGLDDKTLKQKQPGIGLAVDIYFQGVVTDVVPFDLGAGNTHTPFRIGNQRVWQVGLASGESVSGRLFALNAKTQGALVLVRGGAPVGEEAIILEK